MRVGFAVSVGFALAITLFPQPSHDPLAAEQSAVKPRSLTLEEPPEYGMHYARYEPSFYTGFAPRAQQPERVHLHLGRGNQVRVTVVLSDDELVTYARDLLYRFETYRDLIDQGRIKLTQNQAYEEFEKTLDLEDLQQRVAEEDDRTTAQIRLQNLDLLRRLNPGRVFSIQFPEDEILRRWIAQIQPEDRERMNPGRRLELLNLMLPTRLFITELKPESSKALDELVRQSPDGGEPASKEASADFRNAFFRLFDRVSRGIYPRRNGSIRFVEFTAIYPVGSFNEYTIHRGRKIPMYPTPGRRALTTHQRTKTVDHIPTKVIYSYFPWIPYMHVGTNMHNSFHTLWWTFETSKAAFVPPEWISSAPTSRSGRPLPYFWLLSRGPMSHGCTHVTGGHISELRQLLPPRTEQLYKVDVFLNKSHLFDVFDIDGDFQPEVMGVKYFIAYSLLNKRPYRLRVRNERQAFYDWLYGGELLYDADGNGYFADAFDAAFVGRQAVDGRDYESIRLYEAAYEREQIQFYRLIDIPFARELRKIGIAYPDAAMLLDSVARTNNTTTRRDPAGR